MRTIAFSPNRTSGLEGAPVPDGYAFVSEMFSGIQGEGPYVGVRQIFVRLGGCDLRCWWCDTPKSLVRRGPARLEREPGLREFEILENPLTRDQAISAVRRLGPARHHSVTFTGGEPLLQPGVIVEMASEIHALGGRTWVETHGGRVRELEEVIESIDVVSMDIKLPSSSGDFVPLDVHAEFLNVAMAADVFAKIVITPDTAEHEVAAAAEMVAAASRVVPLVLQPVTPFGRIKHPPSPDQMLRFQELGSLVHPDVRVIPQTHKFLGQL